MVGVVILNYNTPEDVKECYNSLISKNDAVMKIYIVDNCSRDNSVEVLSEYFQSKQDVCFLTAEENGGYSKGNNIGIRAAVKDGCDKILIINPDVRVKPSAIDIMSQTLEADEKYGVVGPKIYNENGTVQSKLLVGGYKKFLCRQQPITTFVKMLGNREYLDDKLDFDCRTVVNGMVHGCCFMIKADLFEDIGFFDENVFLYCEEKILYEEIKKRGYMVVYEPDAEIVHIGSTSIGGWTSPVSLRCFAVSELYCLYKYEHNFKGIKRALAVFLTKLSYKLRNIKYKNKAAGKQQYDILKQELKKMKEAADAAAKSGKDIGRKEK